MRLSDEIVQDYKQHGIITDSNAKVAEYGIRNLVLLIRNFILTVLIAVLMGQIWFGLLFMVFFIPLRSFAGGHHANSPFVCSIISAMLVAVNCYLISLVDRFSLAFIIVAGISGTILMISGTVEAVNRPLDDAAKKFFSRMSRCITGALLLATGIGFIVSIPLLYGTASLALTSASGLVLAGKKKMRTASRRTTDVFNN